MGRSPFPISSGEVWIGETVAKAVSASQQTATLESIYRYAANFMPE